MKLAIPAASVAFALSATSALGATALGLAGDRTLVMIDTETATVTGMMEVQTEGRILGIDYRAATGEVIAVTDGFEVVNISLTDGSLTPVVQMSMELPIEEGAAVIVDINPAADALRFMSGTVNHRINLTSGEVFVDGELHFDEGSEHASMTPMVGGTAYSNNMVSPENTAMYNIDTDMNALLRQTAPNDGTNVAIGMTGVMAEGPIAFDIGTDAEGVNTAWLAANGVLHQIDLDSGASTGMWDVEALDVTLRDLTIVPTM